MKFRILILILLFHSMNVYSSDFGSNDSYDDFIERASSLSSPSLASAKSIEDNFNLKLIKTDLNKYLGSLNFKPDDMVGTKYNLIESQIASNIQKVLMWIKKSLTAPQDFNIITQPQELKSVIEKVFFDFCNSIGSDLFFLIGINPQSLTDENTNSQQTIHLPNLEEQTILLFSLILDSYFREQLLRIAFAFLQPLPTTKLSKYKQTTDYKRLQNYCLTDSTLQADTLKTWKYKQHLYQLLYQNLTPPEIYKEDEICLARAHFGISFKYVLNYDYLSKFFQDSCDFLSEDFGKEASILESPEKLHLLAKKYSKAAIKFYRDYQNLLANSLTDESSRKSIIATISPYLAKYLADIHSLYLRHFDALFFRSIQAVTSLEDLMRLTEPNFQSLIKINQIITRHLENTPNEPLSFENRFRTSVYGAHIALLDCLDRLYAKRGLLSQAKTLTIGASRTKDFLETTKRNALRDFPFLFPKTQETIDLSILDQLAKLEQHMKEIDESPINVVTTSVSSLLKTTVSLTSWFSSK